jgi:hypothetical protein
MRILYFGDVVGPALLGHHIAPAHRAHGDTQPIGQIALRRQLVAWRQDALIDRIRNRLGDRPVARAVMPGKIRVPYCHGVNVYIDRNNLSSVLII